MCTCNSDILTDVDMVPAKSTLANTNTSGKDNRRTKTLAKNHPHQNRLTTVGGKNVGGTKTSGENVCRDMIHVPCA